MGIEIRPVGPNVSLVNATHDPIRTLWAAFRTCYSERSPLDLWHERKMTTDEMLEFVERRMKTEHTSPLEHVSFTFAISGVSRVFTHQFVRHRVGVSISQQSGRYTDPIKTGVFEYVEPDMYSWEQENFAQAVSTAVGHYVDAASEKTMSREDARMMLPTCQATNMFVTINLAALLHMADIRMCLATQWEFRNVVNLMRSEIIKVHPSIGRMLGPKCMEYRRGACDEDLSTYHACKLSSVRPHKLEMINEGRDEE